MSVCCKCCVLSGRGLCVWPITRPEESYRLWCVVVCDLETSWMRRPTGSCRAKNKQTHLSRRLSPPSFQNRTSFVTLLLQSRKQSDHHCLCRLLTGYSKLNDFSNNDLPPVSEGFL